MGSHCATLRPSTGLIRAEAARTVLSKESRYLLKEVSAVSGVITSIELGSFSVDRDSAEYIRFLIELRKQKGGKYPMKGEKVSTSELESATKEAFLFQSRVEGELKAPGSDWAFVVFSLASSLETLETLAVRFQRLYERYQEHMRSITEHVSALQRLGQVNSPCFATAEEHNISQLSYLHRILRRLLSVSSECSLTLKMFRCTQTEPDTSDN